MHRELILASASARRRKILADLGLVFRVETPLVAEIEPGTDVRAAALENAARKSAWCRARYPAAYSLAADTLVEFQGRALGKPWNAAEAAACLRMLAGQTHRVFTAVALARPGAEPELVLEESAVTFRPLDDAAIASYVARVNPLDRAGAYDIDASGDLLIAGYTGSRTNIMGLPVELVVPWLVREGLLPPRT